MTHFPRTGDIWCYKRRSYSSDKVIITTDLLILDDSPPDFYTCLNLENSEIGDWMIDHSDEFDNWEYIA